MEVYLEDTTLCGVEAKGEAQVDLEGFHLYSGRASGIWVRESAQIEALDFTIRVLCAIAVDVQDQGRLLLEDSVVRSNMDTALRASGESETRIKRCEWLDNGGDCFVLMDTAQCQVEGGFSRDHHGIAMRLGGKSQLTHSGFSWEGEVVISPGAALSES